MTAPSNVKPPVAPVKTPPSGVPTLGLAEAAKACGVSISTLRRKRPELAAHGAAQTASGWRIPVTALIALGLMGRTSDAPHEARHEASVTPATKASTIVSDDVLTGELDALRVKLAEAEQRAAVAEAIAAERERIIQTQAMALRMLEATKPPADTPPHTPSDTRMPSPADRFVSLDPAPRRRWWHRL